MTFTFEWHEAKARLNVQKHRVAFDEALSVFSDPRLVTFPDHLHSASEERCLGIGCSEQGRVLLVVYTERGDRIRIISSRKATATERKTYES
jgi:uncharacterized protein